MNEMKSYEQHRGDRCCNATVWHWPELACTREYDTESTHDAAENWITYN